MEEEIICNVKKKKEDEVLVLLRIVEEKVGELV